MGHRTLPNAAEVLQVMRHLAEVTALKADPPAQRRRLVDGLSGLFNTTLGWVFAMDDCRPGHAMRPVVAELAAGLDPSWVRYAADFAVRVPPSADPFADHSMRCDETEQQWVTARVLPDLSARRRYAPAVEAMTEAQIGDGAVCLFRTGPGGDRVAGFSLHRCQGDGPMRPRDYALHRFALSEIRRLHDRGHLPALAPPPTAGVLPLPPRQGQVLDRLLRGHAPKAIARDLSLSVWTVRDHVKRVYAHYDVHGRDELMARFLDRPPADAR